MSLKKKEILTIKLQKIEKNIQCHMANLSSFGRMDLKMRREHEEIANHLYEKYFKDAFVEILLQAFSKQSVQKNGFSFGKETKIRCDILERLKLGQDDILSGYLYLFHAPKIVKEWKKECEELPLLEQYYIENWKIAILDAGRDWIRDYLYQKNNTNPIWPSYYVTESFGPGFYGMGMEELPAFFKVLDGKAVGVNLNKNGNMEPLKSCIGIYLVTKKDISLFMGRDCVNCMGNKLGCIACKR